MKQAKSASLILPGERHLRAGKSLGGQIWLQIDDQPIVHVPPRSVVSYATELLKLAGVHVVIEAVDEHCA